MEDRSKLEEQIEYLAGMLRKRRILPCTQRGQDQPVDVRTLCVFIGLPVGFTAASRQPLPGTPELYRGLSALHLYSDGWTAAALRTAFRMELAAWASSSLRP